MTKLIRNRRVVIALSVVAALVILGSVFAWRYSRLTTCTSPVRLDPSVLFNAANLQDDYTKYGYVANSLGSVDGVTHTNSKEAFTLSYEKGFRFFAVDMVLLKDGMVFCAGDESTEMYGLQKPFDETTSDELAGRRCLEKYTPLTGRDLIELMGEYPDAYFILDTEYEHHEILKTIVAEARQTSPPALDRIIPHIAGPVDLTEVSKIYPFRDYVFALYRSECNPRSSHVMTYNEVLFFVEECGVSAVMARYDTSWVDTLREDFSAVGAVVYVRSVNDCESAAPLQDKGVGVYSNGYFPVEEIE